MAFSNFQPQFPQFTWKDYDVWAIKLATTLQAHDVWDYVQFEFSGPKNEVEEQALSNTEREQWKKENKKNAQVLQLIQQGVDRVGFENIMMTSSTKVAWDTLATNYTGNNCHKSVKYYGEDIEDQTVVEKVLKSLLNIEEAKDLTSMTVNEFMGLLLSHKARIDRNKYSTLETTFKSQVSISRDRGRGRSRTRGRGRSRRYGG
eukprot:PITA_31660